MILLANLYNLFKKYDKELNLLKFHVFLVKCCFIKNELHLASNVIKAGLQQKKKHIGLIALQVARGKVRQG